MILRLTLHQVSFPAPGDLDCRIHKFRFPQMAVVACRKCPFPERERTDLAGYAPGIISFGIQVHIVFRELAKLLLMHPVKRKWAPVQLATHYLQAKTVRLDAFPKDLVIFVSGSVFLHIFRPGKPFVALVDVVDIAVDGVIGKTFEQGLLVC